MHQTVLPSQDSLDGGRDDSGELFRPAVSAGTLPTKDGLAYWYQRLTAVFSAVSSYPKCGAGADAHHGDDVRQG